ncbi:hypothetical protein BDV93DRAFT_469006 [Ceratobasidium sp. AG-I]|nr:hypothetical protein BDV93DRAFT_469006 [Ceratobasidium sp. AG-I]
MMSRQADVTAIVLNWARLENVKIIVSNFCKEELRDTISSIIVWNNQPSLILSDAYFEEANVPKGMLRIINSLENLYFQARFLACVEASTHWCFVQDDDYLVSAEAIRALRRYSRLNQKPGNEYPIYLLPPHEHLSTTLRTRATEKLVASFAWLGHGTLLTRLHARSFLDLLASMSNKQDDIMKMADNFFSILFNRRALTWVDPGNHFRSGEEQAFTVGVEGDERNWHYTRLAEEYLEHITSHPEEQALNNFTVDLHDPSFNDDLVTYAPSLAKGSLGIWSTNVPMLPTGVLEAGSVAKDLRSVDTIRRGTMSEVDTQRYVHHPFSCIGDGLLSTSFRSPRGETRINIQPENI